MNIKNSDKPASPSKVNVIRDDEQLAIGLSSYQFGNDSFIEPGLTKRELFAMHAMQAWIQHHGSANNYGFSKDSAALSAVECADALLAELEK